jgi:predicted amidophosphoribosyltransferase
VAHTETYMRTCTQCGAPAPTWRCDYCGTKYGSDPAVARRRLEEDTLRAYEHAYEEQRLYVLQMQHQLEMSQRYASERREEARPGWFGFLTGTTGPR